MGSQSPGEEHPPVEQIRKMLQETHDSTIRQEVILKMLYKRTRRTDIVAGQLQKELGTQNIRIDRLEQKEVSRGRFITAMLISFASALGLTIWNAIKAFGK